MRLYSSVTVAGLMALVWGCAAERDRSDAVGEPVGSDVAEVKQKVIADKGIIVIDRTGSMQQFRSSTDESRCHDVRSQALDKVDEFFMDYSGNALAVWTFSGSSVVNITGGYVGSGSAKAAILELSPEGCSGVTPLADALCQAADALNSFAPAKNIMTFLTDGGENSSVGPCQGNSNGITDSGSWQYKARERINSYFPYVQINPQFWSGDTFVSLSGVDPETGAKVQSLTASLMGCSSTEQCDHEFFLYAAVDSGGTYDLIKDNDDQYPCSYGACPPPYYEPLEF